MPTKDELKKKLKKISAESADRADALLEEELAALRAATKADLEALKPRIRDVDTYKRLMAIVDESTRANENIGQLKERVEKGGSQVVKLAKAIYKLLA